MSWKIWWDQEGSAMRPLENEDTEEFARRITAIAWSNGKFVESEARADDRLDAERYRHMRNNAQFQSRNGPGLYWYLPRFGDGKVRDEGAQLDEAIDSAIRARGQA
jgi:hypothetical protein